MIAGAGNRKEQGLEPPAFENLDAPEQRVSANIGRCRRRPASSVERLTQVSGRLLLAHLRRRGSAAFRAAREVILRIGPPYGLFAPYSAMPEFESLSALADSRVPAPRVYLRQRRRIAMLGAPFFLARRSRATRRCPGASQGQRLDEKRRASLAADFIDALSALHDFDWRATPLAKWGEGVTLDNAAHRQIDALGDALSTLGAAPASDGASGAGVAARPRADRPSTFRSFTATTGSAISSNAMDASPRFSIGNWCISAIPSRISAGPSCRNIAAARRAFAVSPRKRVSCALRGAIGPDGRQRRR